MAQILVFAKVFPNQVFPNKLLRIFFHRNRVSFRHAEAIWKKLLGFQDSETIVGEHRFGKIDIANWKDEFEKRVWGKYIQILIGEIRFGKTTLKRVFYFPYVYSPCVHIITLDECKTAIQSLSFCYHMHTCTHALITFYL